MKKIYLTFFLLFILKASVEAQVCANNSNSLSFNGTSSNVTFSTSNNLDITDSITIEAWIYATQWALTSAQGTIFCKHAWTGTGGERGYVLRAGGNGELNFNIGGDSLGNNVSWKEIVSATGVLNLNTWYHVAGSFDGDSLRLFVNGTQVASKFFHGKIISNTYNSAIGKLSDTGIAGPTRVWNGNLDEIRVWHRAKSSAELLADYNHHLDTSITNTGLVGYWRFNEGTGTLTNDISGSGNNGTLNSTTWVSTVPFNQAPPPPFVVPNGNLLTCAPAGIAYQWNWNGNPILNATNQSYLATVIGTYTVTYTDNSGCSSTSGPYIITSVGISDLTNELQLTVQQADDQLKLNWNSSKKIDLIQLLDINGKIAYATSEFSNGNIVINTSTFSSGIYLLNIFSNGKYHSEKYFIGNDH